MALDPFGPQYLGDDAFTARMRFHQSWWRHERLRAAHGVDARGNAYGNYLTEPDAALGLNFLTPAIHWCARERIASSAGVEEFRCTRNLLSSQPMAFNLFGPLHHDPSLAARLLDPMLPGGVLAASVHLEWTPPKALHLDDATSFDVAVRYTTRHGRPAFAGIETKLTEPFSQKTYGLADRHTDRYRSVARRSSVWLDPDAQSLTDRRWNQMWRNHLLVESIRHREPGLLGCEVVVHHSHDHRCAAVVAGYRAHLVEPDDTLVAFTLDEIVKTWRPLVEPRQRPWLDDFADRYVNLRLSDDAYSTRTDSTAR